MGQRGVKSSPLTDPCVLRMCTAWLVVREEEVQLLSAQRATVDVTGARSGCRTIGMIGADKEVYIERAKYCKA